MSYSLYIEMPNDTRAGDATIVRFDGKYRTYFWGVGAWRAWPVSNRADHLERWLDEVDAWLGRPLLDADAMAVRQAVLHGALRVA